MTLNSTRVRRIRHRTKRAHMTTLNLPTFLSRPKLHSLIARYTTSKLLPTTPTLLHLALLLLLLCGDIEINPGPIEIPASSSRLCDNQENHIITEMAEMNPNYKPPSGTEDRQGKNVIPVDEPKPSTSTDSRAKESKESIIGGKSGGALSSHGPEFHLNTATLLLFILREIHQKDPNFEFHIWLEKDGYDKLDDIVVRYKKSGGKWTEICVQCKHATEKIDENGTKYVSNVTAEDFLTESKNRKDFSLVEYFKSFKIIEDKSDEIERYYVLHSNKPFKNSRFESKYPYFELLDYSEQTGETILDHLFPRKYKIKYSSELLKKLQSSNEDISEGDRDKTIQFCDKFVYVYDNRDLEKEIHEKVAKHCKNNEEEMKILEARLHHLFWEMYQHKRDPDQTFLLNEFFRSIQFNVYRVHANFAGRVKHIQKIKDALESERKKHMLDLLVTGMAGMGKTQLVLKYIEHNKQNHKNIIWINAESKESLEYSFEGIAKHCQLESDTQEIYSYLRHDTLFVFDNADKVLLAKNDKNEYIYLPNNAQCIERNKFIVISQDKKWTTSFIVNVDTFSEEDALEYLDEIIKCSKEDKLKLAATYQYWPLALCLAVSYIKSQPEVQLGLKSYSDVISTLQTDNTKLQEHLPGIHEMEAYNISLKMLWERFKKILDSKDKLALKIVEIMSLSCPDDFPIFLLRIEGFSTIEVGEAVLFLDNNSIVSFNSFFISIHRTLQLVVRNSVVSDTNHFEHTLLLGIKSFSWHLHLADRIMSYGNLQIATFLNVLLDSTVNITEYINLARMLLKKLKKNDHFGSNRIPNEIYDSMITKIEKKLIDTQFRKPDFLFDKAIIFSRIGKYKKALDYFNSLIILCMELGGNQLEISNCLYRKAILLDKMENYDAALDLLNQAIDLKKVLLGNSHTETLNSMQRKAIILSKMGSYAEALQLYETIIELEGKEKDIRHPHTLKCMNKKAVLLFQTKKYEESLRTCDQVTKLAKEETYDNKINYITSLNNKAKFLMKMANYNEASKLLVEVCELGKKNVGGKHPLHLEILLNRIKLSMRLGCCEQAIFVCDKMNEFSMDTLGENHPFVRRISNLKTRYEEMSRDQENFKKIIPPFPNAILQQRLFEANRDKMIAISFKVDDLWKTGKKIDCFFEIFYFIKEYYNRYGVSMSQVFGTLGITGILFLCLVIFGLDFFIFV